MGACKLCLLQAGGPGLVPVVRRFHGRFHPSAVLHAAALAGYTAPSGGRRMTWWFFFGRCLIMIPNPISLVNEAPPLLYSLRFCGVWRTTVSDVLDACDIGSLILVIFLCFSCFPLCQWPWVSPTWSSQFGKQHIQSISGYAVGSR